MVAGPHLNGRETLEERDNRWVGSRAGAAKRTNSLPDAGVSNAGERRDFGPGGEPTLFRSLQFELLHTVPHLPLSQAQFAGGPRLHPTVADEG